MAKSKPGIIVAPEWQRYYDLETLVKNLSPRVKTLEGKVVKMNQAITDLLGQVQTTVQDVHTLLDEFTQGQVLTADDITTIKATQANLKTVDDAIEAQITPPKTSGKKTSVGKPKKNK